MTEVRKVDWSFDRNSVCSAPHWGHTERLVTASWTDSRFEEGRACYRVCVPCVRALARHRPLNAESRTKALGGAVLKDYIPGAMRGGGEDAAKVDRCRICLGERGSRTAIHQSHLPRRTGPGFIVICRECIEQMTKVLRDNA